MSESPRDNEEKLRRVLNAWQTLAEDKTFAGMTVTQFEAAISPSFTSRQTLEAMDDQRTDLLTRRANADTTSLAKVAQVVAGVQADPAYGPDSSLIEAMGYVRKSERKSGLAKAITRLQPAVLRHPLRNASCYSLLNVMTPLVAADSSCGAANRVKPKARPCVEPWVMVG